MPGRIPAARARLIQRIVTQAQKKTAAAPRALIGAFTRSFYHGVGEDDLQSRAIADLAGAALWHLRFGRTRRRGQPLVKVFNPDAATAGFNCPHTIVAVVTDDMPFLVDSVGMVLNQSGLAIHMIVHPILAVRRSAGGRLNAVAAEPQADWRLESWQLFEIDRETDPAQLAALERRIRATLDDVRVAVTDWPRMKETARTLTRELPEQTTPLPASEVAEAKALLEWMLQNHFTFLGYRHYRLLRGERADRLVPDAPSGLGLLRARRIGRKRPTPTQLTGTLREHARIRELLVITKANSVATVHRATYLDYVGIKTFDARGRVTGEHRFLGLWTSSAYSQSPREIPVLQHKIQRVIEQFGLAASSHDGKALIHVLESYPRDELFQASTADLVRIARGIVNLYERQQVRLFVRRDAFERFYFCLVFVPRDRYNTLVRQRIEAIVRDAFGAIAIESQIQLSESVLARVQLLVRTQPRVKKQVDYDALEKRLAAAVRTWGDELRSQLITQHGESEARRLQQRYGLHFQSSYQEDVAPSAATADIRLLEALDADPSGLHLLFYRAAGDPLPKVRIKLFRRESAVPISDVMPILDNLGLRLLSERPYQLSLADGQRWIQDFELEHRAGVTIDIESDGPRLTNTFAVVAAGRVENDGFNRLVLAADLTWREVTILRAYCKWLLQTGIPFSQAYMEQVLSNNARTTGRLARLFLAIFDPAVTAAQRSREARRLRNGIDADLAAVTKLDEDRILRAFRAAIDATLRSNYFQATSSGDTKAYLSFKIDPRRVPDLPQPRPMFEIFVYSPRVEGVHLRKGKVARGGIRWSDRREDFRTEVLGLMKAQNVKNTVIVPVGAKGGFVPKRLPTARDAAQREGIECYQDFIRGLLDLTDNIVDGKTVPPLSTVRLDPDDTYLVVAADKGTATFSDIANAVSADYGFWLGDAFASGGSAGYDHKKMAITARGAWECVRRHFRELGLDVQAQDFTVTGIGDMAGDVFGNGMLRSPHIRLVAAFNHQHIFIDPDPVAARSFKERQRLFDLPRSSWEDYDTRLLSKGGGIYPRQVKSLKLSGEARGLLGLTTDTSSPNEIIRAILRLNVDLLWNGGIGTYVKAHDESQAEIGDRTNDALRIDGRELRARVVGEGGNLGFSQRGRIEYALAGGRLNTDFIDNSAGVNCSDVEVNTKILLNVAIEQRRLKRAARDRFLASMTDEVANLVLHNNYLQSQAISTLESRASERERLYEHLHVIRTLERSGELDRAIEFLPTDEAIAERVKQGKGLTRPELAIVLSYSKIWLYNQLIHTDVAEDDYLANELARYFPGPIQRRFGELLDRHPLRREIIVTATTNSLVNRMGPVFGIRAQEDTGASPGAIARAYAIARESTAMRDVWIAIEALDTRVPADLQYEMMHETARLLRHATFWTLAHHGNDLAIEKAVARLRPGLAELLPAVPHVLSDRERERFHTSVERLRNGGVPEKLAHRVTALELLQAGLDIVELGQERSLPVKAAALVYFQLGGALGLDWIRLQIEVLAVEGHWQAVARGSLRDNLYSMHRRLAESVLATVRRGRAPEAALTAWLQTHAAAIENIRRTQAEMTTATTTDFATLSVALQAVRRLAEQ